jgi:hypothetical protein
MHSGVTIDAEGIQSAGAGAISGISDAVAGALSAASALAQQPPSPAAPAVGKKAKEEYDEDEMAF